MYYPDSDGKPMAENTLQWEWIATIKSGLDVLFEDRPHVFVASDLLWYYVEGNPRISIAPDVMVVFGRPRGHRLSYRQWLENHTPAHVVFEVLSPANRGPELQRKFEVYQDLGVLEYYTYDPGDVEQEPRLTSLAGWQRDDPMQDFKEVETMDGWRSPRLGITFRHSPPDDLRLFYPDGKPFESFRELNQRATENEQQIARLRAKLIAAGIDPDAP